MECSLCKKIYPKENFKKEDSNIYYLRCHICRTKSNSKEYNKTYYEYTKKTNIIICDCGAEYVAFRNYHITRHKNSLKHLQNIKID